MMVKIFISIMNLKENDRITCLFLVFSLGQIVHRLVASAEEKYDNKVLGLLTTIFTISPPLTTVMMYLGILNCKQYGLYQTDPFEAI